MSVTALAIRGNSQPRLDIIKLNHAASSEVSELLLSAMTCIENDEAIALDFVKKASRLLRPHYVISDAGVTRDPTIAIGGLAPWQINRLKTYIAERISSQISLHELARLVKLSTSYFSSAFKASIGLSPHNYIVAQRVEFAKHLMLNTDAPLCEIALDCGLADQAHLSRVFRRLTGATPSAWRRFVKQPAAIIPTNNVEHRDVTVHSIDTMRVQ
ncbi:helix-turn-helix domain-containing protein [Phyllobacterium sophorae]|uniref:AraC family transcriptional regulator n=1 Tax=Phyllobacterium sophorae TaxID=1520277 RepID=A0A2P7B5W1_9HYPH|nr:AraC family transcriptional regulator [Phyllobacterium sophorae]PSH61843.1 AraC family transcriptional regulator [Phyllobacterium sophorae]